MVSNRKKRILVALYHDYHLFGYFGYLVPLLLERGYHVTVMTCDDAVKDKFMYLSKEENLNLVYRRYLRIIIRLLENRFFRPVIWGYGWVWSFFFTRGYDLVIVPRDARPFQHMISFWRPTLICQPGLSNDEKRYLRHKYAGTIPFPVPKVVTRYPLIDNVFGKGVLKPVRGGNQKKYYGVLGQDFLDYYAELGIPRAQIKVTGNPNYEGLLFINPTDDEANQLRKVHNLIAAGKIFIFFASQLEFSNDELTRLRGIIEALGMVNPESIFAIKTHPRMTQDNIKRVEEWGQKIEGISIRLITNVKGDENNMRLISLANAVCVEESNVGLLAAWREKPVLVMKLSDKAGGNIYTLYEGILDITDVKLIPIISASLNDPEQLADVIAAQNKMTQSICIRVESPNQKVVEIIDQIFDEAGKV